MLRTLPTLASLLLLTLVAGPFAAPLSAQSAQPPIGGGGTQEASFTGVVQPLDVISMMVACLPSHTLECSDGNVLLNSAEVDLDLYVGQNVKLYGTRNQDCSAWKIHSVETPPATLAICGTGGFGCPIRVRSGPDGLAQHWLFVSPYAGFIPLNLEKGSLLLSEPFVLLATQSSTPFSNGAAFDFSIPVAPALAGVTLYFQSARREVPAQPGPTLPVHFSNAVCLEIVGATLLCLDAGC